MSHCIATDLFVEAIAQNELDPVEQLARVLCRRDDLAPDESVSVRKPGEQLAPPVMRAWMWYIDEAKEMLTTDAEPKP